MVSRPPTRSPSRGKRAADSFSPSRGLCAEPQGCAAESGRNASVRVMWQHGPERPSSLFRWLPVARSSATALELLES